MNDIYTWDFISPNIYGTPRTTHEVVPIVKLTEKMTYDPWNYVCCNSCVIKIQDLVSKNGTHTNKIYQLIVDGGGIHDYFGWDGHIVLSSIAPDETIFGLSIELYAEIIGDLKPNSYLTPDGETYLGKSNSKISTLEIERIIDDTEYLVKDSTSASPIGLVKGNDLNQIEYHTSFLLEKGMEKFCFHAGDYLYNGSSSTINNGIKFQSAIRKHVPHLMSYGVGSYHSMKQFSQADEFITQSHYTRSFYGEYLVNGKWLKKPKFHSISKDSIMGNLSGLINIASNLNKGQCSIDYWMDCDILPKVIDPEVTMVSSIQGGQ